MNIVVERMETEVYSGDWHDKPLRWKEYNIKRKQKLDK